MIGKDPRHIGGNLNKPHVMDKLAPEGSGILLTEEFHSPMRISPITAPAICEVIGAITTSIIVPANILEIGPGNGWMAYNLKIAFPLAAVDIIDISQKVLDFIETNYGIPGRLLAMEALEDDQTYDVIVLSQTIEHTDNIEDVVSRVYRALRPAGIAIYVVPWKWGYDPRHNYVIDERFIDLLKEKHHVTVSESFQHESKLIVAKKVR